MGFTKAALRGGGIVRARERDLTHYGVLVVVSLSVVASPLAKKKKKKKKSPYFCPLAWLADDNDTDQPPF
jgi:hypothetical protein